MRRARPCDDGPGSTTPVAPSTPECPTEGETALDDLLNAVDERPRLHQLQLFTRSECVQKIGAAELRDAMVEAGFRRTQVYAKLADAIDDEGNAYVEPVMHAESELEDSFIVLVVGRV